MRQQRNTKQKQMVLELVQAHCDHPSADQIYVEARAIDGKISRGTVYRNLKQLSEAGDINHVKVPRADRYDCRLDFHYHLFCTECGAVIDAPLAYQKATDLLIAKNTDFKIERHRMIFEGLCPHCAKE